MNKAIVFIVDNTGKRRGMKPGSIVVSDPIEQKAVFMIRNARKAALKREQSGLEKLIALALRG